MAKLPWRQSCFSFASSSRCEPYLHLWAAKQTTGKKRIARNWSLEPYKSPLPPTRSNSFTINCGLYSPVSFPLVFPLVQSSIQRSKMLLRHQINPLCCQHRNGEKIKPKKEAVLATHSHSPIAPGDARLPHTGPRSVHQLRFPLVCCSNGAAKLELL